MTTQNTKDGGAAFPSMPTLYQVDEGTVEPIGHEGMSLRDWFAGQALVGMIASSPLCDRTDPNAVNKSGWARQAYEFADAMLAKRDRG